MDSRDHPRGRSRPHKLDTSKEDHPKNRERFCSVGESYDDSFSHSYRDENRSRHMKRRRDNESPLSSVSRSDSSDERARMPNNVKTYDGTGDPEDHVKIFQAAAQVARWAMPTWCHMFNSTLIGAARVRFDELPPGSIDSYKDLKAAFLAYLMQQKKYVKDPVEIHNIKQKDGETIEDFMERFKVETERVKGAPEYMRIFGFMHGVNNLELTKRLNEHVPKTMKEMMIATTAFIREEAVAASKKKGKEGGLIGSLPLQRRQRDSYSRGGLLVIIGDTNHSTRAWMNFMIVRLLSPYNGIIGRPGIREIQAVPSTVHGMLKFLVERGIVTIHSTVLIPTEYTLVITSSTVSNEERTRPDNFKVALHPNFRNQEVAIEGTLSDKGRTKLYSILTKNLDIFAWQPSDMTGVPRGPKIGGGRDHEREDYYPPPEIDWKVESLCGYPFKCFLDAYKGYHQIQLAESDEEKTVFHTGQGEGVFLGYVVTPDGIKPCPDKTAAVLQLPSPRTIKETLFTDGSSCVDGSSTGLILTNPEGMEFTYALRFQFAASNNEAEYEALIAGLRIVAQMGVKNVQASVDSKLVANQVLGTYVAKEDNMVKYLDKVRSLVRGFTNFSISQVPRSQNKKADALSKITSTSFAHLSKQVPVEVLKDKSIKEKEVTTVVEEDRPTWMTPIVEYLKEGTLPSERNKARKLRIKARHLPCEIVSDNEKQFSDNPFKDWCDKLNITQRFASVKHPQSNELVESKSKFGRRNQGPPSHGDTPFSLTYGTEAVIVTEIGMPTYRTATVDVVSNDGELRLNLDLLEERRERAAICEAKAKSKMTKYYIARVRGVTFRPGDFVYRSNDASHAVSGGKLGPK
nr:reverse transcriptase domain-containing protein [Tanacetum cinerariifolium]GEY96769.1 reverse transcriptase domain-containing protein [Tanacetum cinerariifolium]